MVDGKNFKETVEEEKLKWKEMSFKKKLIYFKDYYMWWTILIVVGLVCFFTWLFGHVILAKKPVVKGMCINLYMEYEDANRIRDEYPEFAGYDPKKYSSEFAIDEFIDFSLSHEKYSQYDEMMAIYAQVVGGNIYYFLVEDTTLYGMTDSGLIVSPDELLSKEFLDELASKDALIYTKDFVPEELWSEYSEVYAIDLGKLGFDADKENDNYYLLFSVAMPHDDNAENIIRFYDQFYN